MKKITSFLLMMLFIGFGLQAQQPYVQEIPLSPDRDNAFTFIENGNGTENNISYSQLPANTVINGIVGPKTDTTGTFNDYSQASHSSACQLGEETEQKVDYTQGVFIVNEDWYGHQNSTVNFITSDGEWVYRAFQKENPGMELGGTNQYGTIYGDKFYFVAKQAKDPGATNMGARFTVCDAKTLKCLKQFENISVDEQGASNADGRAFLGVSAHKGYIGSNNGIYVYDMDNMEIKGRISGSDNPEEDGYGSLYRGQVGTMVRVNENVYAVHQSAGILVIDAEADTLKRVIAGPGNWEYGSIVLSKDGNLWASVANPTGSGQAAPFIYKINPATCDTVRIDMPEGIYAPANSWYAWTPDCFCASKQNNTLYWNGGNDNWFSNQAIFKYDIDKGEFSKFIDLAQDPDKWIIYGCSFRIHPVTDNAYVSLYHSFQDRAYITRVYDNAGKIVNEYSMISNYWFPSLPVFPDNEGPAVATPEEQTASSQDPFTISLATLATDADNMDAAIVKSIKEISDPEVLTAAIVNGDLKVTPQGKAGESDVALVINSNGKVAETIVALNITTTSIGNEEFIVRSAYSNGHKLYIRNCEGFHFTLYRSNGTASGAFNCENNNYSITLQAGNGFYILKGSDGKEDVTFKVVIK